jgi:CheY-like chemotaxis protein
MAETLTQVPGRKKLIVVEDDPETRELELFLLASEGYHALGVDDGEHATATIKREAADLVILDLMLPHKDGLQILAELADDPATARTPVIVVSAYVQPMRRHVLRNAPQVRRIFDKPFDVTELLEAVAHELSSA